MKIAIPKTLAEPDIIPWELIARLNLQSEVFAVLDELVARYTEWGFMPNRTSHSVNRMCDVLAMAAKRAGATGVHPKYYPTYNNDATKHIGHLFTVSFTVSSNPGRYYWRGRHLF